MKPTIPALAIIAATAGLTQAGFTTIDLSGVEFFDGLGDADNTVLEIAFAPGFSANITSISWNLNLTTFTDFTEPTPFPSWAQEATIQLGGYGRLSFASGDDFGVIDQNYSGSLDNIIDGPFEDLLDTNGILRLEFWETFDDDAGNADSRLGSDSSITIHYLPTPSSLAALGLAGLICTQRRRR